MEAAQVERVILHIDVDCFYAQVEESRRPELKGRPLGIYQKFLVVTCNYPARNAGVAKMCPKEDALRVCPDLVLVNGEDLTPYRAVSKRILEVMRRFGVVERRGMDEAYLDVTEEVRKRMNLAVGPNPVYRGFIGKVLAGPTEDLSGTGFANPNPNPPTNSQATPRGEPSLRSIPAQKPEAPASDRVTGWEQAQVLGLDFNGGSEGIEKDRTASEGGVASGPTEGGGTGQGSSPIGARQGGQRNWVLDGQGFKAGVATAENGGRSGEGNDCVELTKWFVPPGWRPLMRADARGRGQGHDVITGADGNSPVGAQPIGAPSPEAADPDNRNPATPVGEPPELTASQPGAITPVTLNPGGLNPGTVNYGTLNLGSSYPKVSQCRAAEPPCLSLGSSNLDAVNLPLIRPVTSPGRSQYASLAEAFGDVLKPQEKSSRKSPDETGPPRKRVRSEPEAGSGAKTPSWLEWRNEADPGLPAGAPSPEHNSPGKIARGKLPGHWSDVRQVRFQAPAPEGVLKTTEKLDFGADVAGSDWLLLVGSHVAAEVREAVWAEVGCRCSAGVAHNKMLAKLASPMNKPNGQTTMLARAVAGHIRNLAARKIPGIGWSYDAKLREMQIDTIGDLQKLALSELEEKFGARVGGMIYHCCRGEDTSPVEDKGPPKSLSVEDSFRACLNSKQAEGIVKALAPDYIDRLDEERDDTGRRPKTLTVKWRQKGASYQGQSTSGPMPLDIVATSLPKARREDALVRSAMSLLSKAFAGKRFHLVKLNVGATNFVEEAAKGTPTLLSAWAGMERNGSGTEGNGGLGEGAGSGIKMESKEGGGIGAENKEDAEEGGRRGSGTERNGFPLMQSGTEWKTDWPSGRITEAEKSGAFTGEDTSNVIGVTIRESQNKMLPGTCETRRLGTTTPFATERTESPNRTPGEGSNGRAGEVSFSPPAKSSGVPAAVAGSVLHANLGSKREARASREAAEGVKPVLGNGHGEAKPSWFVNPSGLTGPGEEFDDQFVSEWDLEEGCFSDRGKRVAGRGFDLDAGEESDEREDLWEDLQSVRLEKRGLRVETRLVSGGPSDHGGGGRSALNVPQLMDGIPIGLVQRNEEEGSRPIGAPTDGMRSHGWFLGTERNSAVRANATDDGKQSEAVDYVLKSCKAEGVEGKGFGKGELSPSRQGSSLAAISPVALSPHKTDYIPSAHSEQLRQAFGSSPSTLVEASTSVSYGTPVQKGMAVKTGVAREKCSVCGEALPTEPAARREHVDFHIAMKLQKEEEKIGRLFKEVSSRTGRVTKGASSSEAKPSRVVSNGRAPKRSVQTLEALWKRS